MSEVVVTARKWGNSVGFTIPSETAEEEKIKPNDKVIINLRKVVPIKDLFGLGKFKKSAQQIKDELRKGWGE
ncbi:MAG: AbrB/MazE/SpoVT family DNA-binding domain-containing protein [archaeon]